MPMVAGLGSIVLGGRKLTLSGASSKDADVAAPRGVCDLQRE